MLALVKQTAGERGLTNVVVQQAPAERLPFADASFDIVLCRFTAHHWHNFEAGLREARRVLKPGGGALFADVISPAHPLLDTHLQTLEMLRDMSHVRNYSLAEWTASLARSGFSPTSLVQRKLRMDFPVWTARTNTPEPFVAALRLLQAQASAAVRAHFAIGPDGGFDLDTATIEAKAN
jgi:SAM-dependent methyltransferase